MSRTTKASLTLTILATSIYANSASAWFEDRYDGTYDIECSSEPDIRFTGTGPQRPFASYYQVTMKYNLLNPKQSIYMLSDSIDSNGDGVGDGIIKASCEYDASGNKVLTVDPVVQQAFKDGIKNNCLNLLHAGVKLINRVGAYTPDPTVEEAVCTNIANDVNNTVVNNLFTPTTPAVTKADKFYVDYLYQKNVHAVFLSYGNQIYYNDAGQQIGSNQFTLHYPAYDHFATDADNFVGKTYGSCVGNTWGNENQIYNLDILGPYGLDSVVRGVNGEVNKGLALVCSFPNLYVDLGFSLHHEYVGVKE